MDMFSVHTIDEIQDLLDAHDVFKANMPAAQEEYESIMALHDQLEDLGSKENPYTSLTIQDISQRWGEVLELVPKRDALLVEEKSRQERNEQLRVQYAQKANVVGPWLQERKRELNDLALEHRGSLEEQLKSLHAVEERVTGYKVNMDELDVLSQRLQEALIFENPHTEYSISFCRISYEQLRNSVAKNVNEIENQILTRDSKGITEEQLKELRNSFDHFDKNQSHTLDPNEFRQCLVSLGFDIGEGEKGNAEFDRLMAIVDPNNTQKVTFQGFLDFMTREMSDQDTAEQVLESFRILAGDKPYITEDELRRELPPDQADYCISRMSPYEGEGAVPGALDYMSFSTALYGESDL